MQKVGNIVNQGIFPGMMGGMGGGLALNQLLVVMDGIDNSARAAPLPRQPRELVPRRHLRRPAAARTVPTCACRPPRPLGAQIYFIGATNVPDGDARPGPDAPGRMGRHVWFRTPTKEDRKDIFDLYLDKVAHDPDLDTPERRDEIARITNGYSPAMIDQICSMALTNAHHEGQDVVHVAAPRRRDDGDRVRHGDRRPVHPAGDARGRDPRGGARGRGARLPARPRVEPPSIRMRGGSLGHHQFFDYEERFSRWQSEDAGDLIHTVGAMAAEHVFYGENSGGVGGDLGQATARAASMVGVGAWRPRRSTSPARSSTTRRRRRRRSGSRSGSRALEWG